MDNKNMNNKINLIILNKYPNLELLKLIPDRTIENCINKIILLDQKIDLAPLLTKSNFIYILNNTENIKKYSSLNNKDIIPITYEQFVELTEQHEKIICL